MTKKKKNVLKALIKECLIEILAEGLVGNRQATVSEKREFRGALQEAHDNASISSELISSSNSGGNFIDRLTSGINETRQSRQRVNTQGANNQVLNSKIKSYTSDPVMSSILQDTAQTTLITQSSKSSGTAAVMAAGDQAAKIAEASDPMQLFGGAAQNWAALAEAPKMGNIGAKIARAKAGGHGF